MRRTLLIFLMLSLTSIGFAADKAVEDLLAKMRKAYSNVKTASFHTLIMVTQGGQALKVNLDVEYATPNKIRADMDLSGLVKGTVYCDGKTVTVVREGSEDASDQPYSIDSLGRALFAANLETINFFDWKRQLSTDESGNMHTSKLKIVKSEKWNGKTWTMLEETAEDVGVFVRYFIDPKTNLIWRTVVKRIPGDVLVMDAQITRLTLGAKIDAKRFKPPK